MKRNIFLILFLITIIGTSLQAQINTKVNLSFESKVQSWLTENNVPAVGIGLIENGKIKYVKVFGELQKGVPAPDNAIFNIASMTKPIVAMMTLKLVEAGQWNLDEPLFHYWVDPDVANNPMQKKLTTRLVLSHQTGFPNWRKGKLTFEFEPGTNYQYSGEGFEYLRKALKIRFNKPMEELLDSLIFKPLGMKDTRYWTEDIDMKRYARWHNSDGQELKTTYKTGVSAADLLLTTIEDYSKFMIYVMNGAGLSSKLFNDMIKSQVNVKKHLDRGLGWEIVSGLPNGEYSLQHGGSDGGAKTMGIILPKSKRGVVVFTNGDNGMLVYNNVIKESIDIGENIVNNNSDAHKTIVLSGEIMERYVGNYLDSYGRNHTITKEDSVLKFKGNGLPTVNFIPEAMNKFFLKDFDVQIEFINDDSLMLIANGKIDWTAKKIKQQPVINLPDDVLERYVGIYVRLDKNSDIHVIKGEGNTLKMSGETVPPLDLLPTGENIFFAKGFPYQFEFMKNESGKVTKMNVIGNGKVVCETKRKD
jgi:CubicO group peptidase (beta-lactamase class C family)